MSFQFFEETEELGKDNGFSDTELTDLLQQEFKQLKNTIVANPLCDLRQQTRNMLERFSIGQRT